MYCKMLYTSSHSEIQPNPIQSCHSLRCYIRLRRGIIIIVIIITRVEELELLVRVAAVHNVKILLFQPVHLRRLHCQPYILKSNVRHKNSVSKEVS